MPFHWNLPHSFSPNKIIYLSTGPKMRKTSQRHAMTKTLSTNKEIMALYHIGCRGDIREQVDRNIPGEEHSGRQAGKALAAATAGGMSPGIVANHHPSLLKALKAVLQVATQALTGETNEVSRRK